MSRIILSGLGHSRLQLRKLVRLRSGEIEWIRPGGLEPPDVLAPSEYAPVWPVDLPLAQASERQSALPFALEERLSQPIEELHFALGDQIESGKYSACAVERARMSAWIADLARHGIAPGRIMPEAAALPAPSGEATWSVAVDIEHVLVRTQSGGAFSAPIRLWSIIWREAGEPMLLRCGEDWDAGLPEPVASGPRFGVSGGPAVNLLQGDYRRRGSGLAESSRVAATILAVALAAHVAALGGDAAILSGKAKEARARTAQLAQQLAPELSGQMPAADVLMAILPSGAPGGDFVPLLADVSQALAPGTGTGSVSVRSLTYTDAEAGLELQLDGAALADLDRVADALRGSALLVESVGARTTPAGAEQTLRVRRAGAAS